MRWPMRSADWTAREMRLWRIATSRACHRVAGRAGYGAASPTTGTAFLDYGCIAVDEVQDLTPLEAFVVLALARR